jgi:CubicO group peptidase (beta-lactamase class C family)
MTTLGHLAPSPVHGSYADGFAPVAHAFAALFREQRETGAGVTVYHRGACVVDLWGGHADVEQRTPFERDSRVVVFSATKGLAAMALHLLADRGLLEWDAPVATYWPGFAKSGKAAITVRTLFNHRGGLAALDTPVSMADCVLEQRYPFLVRALESQAPLWKPEHGQGYHAITFGMYARELFERIAGESMGRFLARELFEPLEADVSLGTKADLDARIATLYPPSTGTRLTHLLVSALEGGTTETRVAEDAIKRHSIARRAFLNPSLGERGIRLYDGVEARRGELAWAGATASAHGLARAYLPFASRGSVGGRRYLKESTLAPLYTRQGWSDRDAVLQKPLGWAQGFLKEEPHLFSPVRESFGHPGMGGALGWCDPVHETTIGYVPNRLDWRVRSPRAVGLCRALYQCEPMKD